jgi:beta-mannosidase
MIEQSLNGSWSMRETGTAAWLPAEVPGGVHLDLLAAGRIADPFVGDEELRVLWVAERGWEYRREFVVDPELAAAEHVAIVFDGLDTLAEIHLNGQPLGRADNMFRTWRWDVTGRLRSGMNELAITFESAVKEAAALDAVRHLDCAADQLAGGPYLRKAPYHFGWDWGTRLPNVGLWQGVRLEGWSVVRLADVRVGQAIEGGRARIYARVRLDRAGPGKLAGELAVSLRVVAPSGETIEVASAAGAIEASAFDLSIAIDEPELWWPNGMGAQPLYQVAVELADGSGPLEQRSYRIGLRTLELRREPDEWGESFTFVVNGVPAFAKGANWIPADAFPGRISPARLKSLLGAAAAANHNMVRVWGGGYYELEAFYDACDRFGLLVWQDFMFACSVYPLHDPAFVAGVQAEVAEQVRRLRHRACLALWCGNNEMERGWVDWGWDRPDTQDLKAAYLEFFGTTLPGWVAAEDGATPYWPSSPSSGRPLEKAVGSGQGDEHEWRVWHGLAPFSAYARETYRFVSEFGFESLPAAATIAAFAPNTADWNLGSPILDHHQRCEAGNARILYYLAQQFRLPRDFGGLVYLSQVLQAEAMRVGVEHWRRDRERCGGALYWQLNDSWPVSSWSSIDYFGRWKALHYATRRFFDPVLLSCALEAGDAVIYVTNDLAGEWRGRVHWSLEDLDGHAADVPAAAGEAQAAAGEIAVAVQGLATARIAAVRIPEDRGRQRSTVLVAELYDGSARRTTVVTPFVPDKHLALRRATFEATIEPLVDNPVPAAADRPARAVVRLRSDALARWVELTLEGADAAFDDNYLDLPAGREASIGLTLPPGWTIETARAALKIRSVADTWVE